MNELKLAEALCAIVFILDAREYHRVQAARSVAERESEMKYTWKVIHQVVGKLEESLNRMQREGFQVYSILPAGDTGTALEMGATFAVVGRKEVDTLTAVP